MPTKTTRFHGAVVVAIAAAGLSIACKGSGACVEGAYKDGESGVCLKLPAEYKAADKPSKSGDSSYLSVRNTKTFRSFTIWIEKPDDLDKRAKVVANMASSDLKLVDSGDTSPNKGKFFHFHSPQGNYDFAVALVPGKEHFYRCEIQNTPPEDAKAMVDACKSLGGP
jgi:hypothetical protein